MISKVNNYLKLTKPGGIQNVKLTCVWHCFIARQDSTLGKWQYFADIWTAHVAPRANDQPSPPASSTSQHRAASHFLLSPVHRSISGRGPALDSTGAVRRRCGSWWGGRHPHGPTFCSGATRGASSLPLRPPRVLLRHKGRTRIACRALFQNCRRWTPSFGDRPSTPDGLNRDVYRLNQNHS